MTNGARKESSMGNIVNLMSVDVSNIVNMTRFSWALWSCTLQIAVALYLLYEVLGQAMFAGLGLLVRNVDLKRHAGLGNL